MKNRHFVIILSLSSALVISVFIIYMLLKENKVLRQNLPYLLVNEQIEYFDLITINEEMINDSILEDKISLIFIFKQPCNLCNENILMWKKIAKILKGQVNIYGIILSGYNEIEKLTNEKSLNFDIYLPIDNKRFMDEMRVRLNDAQTIICNNKKVAFVKLGVIDGESYLRILRTTKRMMKESNVGS